MAVEVCRIGNWTLLRLFTFNPSLGFVELHLLAFNDIANKGVERVRGNPCRSAYDLRCAGLTYRWVKMQITASFVPFPWHYTVQAVEPTGQALDGGNP